MASLLDDEDQIYLNENLQQTETSDDDEDFVNIHERVVEKMGLRLNPKQNEETNELDTSYTKLTQLTPKRTNDKKKRNSFARHEQSMKVLDELLESAADNVSSPVNVEEELKSLEIEGQESNDDMRATKKNEKKRSRAAMEDGNDALINKQAAKRRRTVSNRFGINEFQTKRASSVKSRILSRSHRVHSKRMAIMIPSNKRSHSAKTNKQKSKKRKRKNDPFHIDIPRTMMSPILKKRKLSNTVNQSQTKNKKKKKKSSYPQSMQLQQLTRSYDGIKSPSSNHTLFSTLPQSQPRKKKRKLSHIDDDIQEIHTNVHELALCSQSQRSNDKREIDASSDENDEVRLRQPEWLKSLTNKATKCNKNDKMQNNESPNCKKKKKENPKNLKFWQYNSLQLKKKRESRRNTINTFKDCFHQIPADLGVTERMTLKILKIRRLSFYDLYAAVCCYANEQNERVKVKYALLYFECSVFEHNPSLNQYDFITIYRPWNDMKYIAKNKEGAQIGCIRVMAPIKNLIKCDDVKNKVAHFDLFPKYNVNKFKNIIFQRNAMLEPFEHEMDYENDAGSNDDESESEVLIESDENNGDDHNGTMEEDDLFWLRNIEQIINSEMEKNEQERDFELIAKIPPFENFDRPFHVRGVIQRIFAKEDESNICVLVQDTSGYCCMMRIECNELRLNGIDCNKIEDMMRCESMWFDFRNIELREDGADFDESELPMLVQFDYDNLQSIDCVNMDSEPAQLNEQKQMTDFYFYGMRLGKGALLKDGKIYYHFEHFSKETNENSQNDILQRMRIRQLKCGKIMRCAQNDSKVGYCESLIFALMDIEKYLKRFWRTKMCSMRLSFAVRIVCKSLLFDNVIYISDNSLLDDAESVHFVPLTVTMENVSSFGAICDVEHMDNANLYASQPLVILRDVLLNFTNLDGSGSLELRFDDYSQVQRVDDDDSVQRKCGKMRHNHCLIDIERLRLSPWIALNSVMVSIKGIVELVSINDGYNKHCNECAMISVRNETMNQNESESIQYVACLKCFLRNGQIRVVLQQNEDFVVVVVPGTNVWFKGNNFGQNNKGNSDTLYLQQFNALKQRLQNIKIVSDCIIEYNQNKEAQCFSSLFCMF